MDVRKEWILSPVSVDLEKASRQWDVSNLVAQLLINRGLSHDAGSEHFLFPQLSHLHAPETLPGADQAAALIVEAIAAKQRIAIYGDYDVDGITGTAILWHILMQAGADVCFYVPHRIEEGYGLNIDAVRRLIEDGASLIISVDCGITAVDVADVVNEAGAQLIITDHHTPRVTLPQAAAIVHPRVGGESPNPDLAGAGVAFKLAWAIAKKLSGADRVSPEYRQLMLTMLPLAALGTIADMVPLDGENRVIAKHGLAAMATSSLPGVQALIKCAGMRGSTVSDYDVGFKLSPRINAAGRMGHARLAVELFTRADETRANEIALYLEEHNRSRQATERRVVKQACEMVDKANLAGDARRAIVLASEGWHSGVIGIVASRLVNRYQRPTVVISLDGDLGQGSARSIPGFHLADALSTCEAHLESCGGHAAAAGLRISLKNLEAFTEQFVTLANQTLTGKDLIPKLRLDAMAGLDELTLPVMEVVKHMGPFGTGNPKPRLATDWIELANEPRCVGRGGEHLQATFRDKGLTLKAIGFGLARHIEDLKQYRRCQVAFEPIVNEYNGRRSVEMQMLDIRFPQQSSC